MATTVFDFLDAWNIVYPPDHFDRFRSVAIYRDLQRAPYPSAAPSITLMATMQLTVEPMTGQIPSVISYFITGRFL